MDDDNTPIDPKIIVTGNGPNLCYGVAVTLPDGTIKLPDGSKPIALCACGKSASKPTCDGSHSKK